MTIKNDKTSRSFLLNILLSGIVLYVVYNGLICGLEKFEMEKGIIIAVFSILLLYSLYSLIIYCFEFLAVIVLILGLVLIAFKVDFSAMSNIKIKEKTEISWKG